MPIKSSSNRPKKNAFSDKKTNTLKKSSSHHSLTSYGLVVSRVGKEFLVEAVHGANHGQRYICRAKNHLDLLVGDFVHWEITQNEKGWITDCDPRETLIERFAHGHSTKRMAANVSAMVIVVAPKPAPSRRLIDQYLVAATLFGCTPIITMNKCELITPNDPIDHLIKQYTDLNFTCLRISTKQHIGLDALAQTLASHRAILLGQSGVGKSSLVKAWLPNEAIVVGELSGNASGRHTTSHSTLYHLPAGGQLIDAPGIREFKLTGRHPISTLAGAFPDIQPILNDCRFRNCSHQHEPDCALKKAVNEGKLDERRFQDYLAIITEFGAQ